MLIFRRLSTIALIARSIAVLILILCASTPFAPTVVAQTGREWSTPVDVSAGIATTPPQGWGPVIAADQDGRLHAVWPECSTIEDNCKSDTIYYAVWRAGTWSQPVDVLAAPVGEGVVTQVLTADPYGRLVLVWMGNRGLNISIAEAASAGTARAWMTTTLAAQDAVRTSDLLIDDAGVYHLIYIANDRAIEHSVSADSGASWTDPVNVYTEDRSDAAPTAPKIARDHNGSVYACWTATSEATNWGAVGVQFSRSIDGGASWAPIQMLAEGQGLGSCSLLVDSKARLHAFWLGSADTGGRYHRWSTDGGDSWTATQAVAAPDEITGFPGAPRLLEDSLGIVHAVFPGYGPAGEQIWHVRWDEGSWTRPVPISADLPHSEKSAAALVDGKYLHVVWLEYKSLDFWHAYSDTGAPAMRAEILPLPTAPPVSPLPIGQPEKTLLPTREVPSATPSAPVPLTTTPAPAAASGAWVLAISLAPALLLVGGVIVSRLFKRR